MTLAELEKFGEELGREVARAVPCVITLEGDLGAGKTTLTRAIGRGFGISEPVTSPTYALVHEYFTGTPARFFHLDLYRVQGPHELANLGWDDMLATDAVLIVEWPDRAAGYVPDDAVHIRLAHVDGDPARRRVSW